MRDLLIAVSVVGAGLVLLSRPARAYVKAGVQLDGLDPVMAPAVQVATAVALELTGEPATITSGLEGEHSSGSLHYEGLAFDVRRADRHVDGYGHVHFLDPALAKRQADAMRAALPDSFDVVLERTHVHIEYDPATALV